MFSRIRPLVFIVLILAGSQILHDLFDWYRHREAREELIALRERVVDAGAELVREHLEADRIRAMLESQNARSYQAGRSMGPNGRAANGQPLTDAPYASARQGLEDPIDRIRSRNEMMEELRITIVRRNSAAERYNVLADSLRWLAVEAGDPYHAIPLPAEAAAQRGIVLEAVR